MIKVENGIVKNNIANSILINIFKILFNLLKLLFCLFITVFVGYFITLIIIGKFDWQILFYEIISIFTIIGVWITAFAKVKNRTVIIYALICILWFGFANLLPSVKKQIDMDNCIDIGDCTGVYKK